MSMIVALQCTKCIFPYSDQVWENTDQNNSEHGHFWPSANPVIDNV